MKSKSRGSRKKRIRGSGTVYLRGKIWWIQYWDHGLPRNESSKSEDKSVAESLLRQKIVEVAATRGLTPEQCTVADLCHLVLDDYALRGLRDVKTVEWRYNAHVKEALGHIQARKWASSIPRRYIRNRRLAGAPNSTINRELSIVRRGFALGMQEDPPLVRRVPKIPKLEEDNARQGFLDPEQYEKLLEKLPHRLKALYVCGYHVGTRKGELRKIRIEQVDFDAKIIRIEKAQAKGKKPRTLPVYGDMERWLREQIGSAPAGCPWVFHNGKGRLVGAQMKGWHEACEAAAMPAFCSTISAGPQYGT